MFLPIMSTNVQIISLMFIHFNHVAVEFQFQLLVFRVLKKANANFFAHDLRANVVLGC